VSDDGALLTDRALGLALLNRETIYTADQLSIPLDEAVVDVDEAVLDALFDFSWLLGNQFNVAGAAYDHEAIGFMLQEPDFGLVDMRDGLLYFQRGRSGLAMTVEKRPLPDKPIQHQFGDSIGLVDVRLEEAGSHRFRLEADWVALRPLTDTPPLIAVSRPGGLDHARIAHLPTLALLPTTEWSTDQIVRETFEFALPEETPPGEYPLYLGWYDSSNLFAAETDGRSRVGEEVQIGVLIVR
jgi:hypothetical protein